ncbi:MAG: metallophosphoesterase family protein [Dehalococcoidia bacterium]|nr:metallophosphoesterase family protein [Dehalococcoidia bacterium]
MARPSLRLLHCADLHLTHSAWDASIATLRALREVATQRGAEQVLMAGDLFDSSKQPDAFSDAVAEEMAQFPVFVAAIPGNHDLLYSRSDPDPFGRLFDQLGREALAVTDEAGACVELAEGRMRLWGRGMPEHTPENDPLAGLPLLDEGGSWRVAMAHGYLMDAPNGRSSPIIPRRHRAALGTYDYVALGHHHSPHRLDFEGTLLMDSGSASPIVGHGSYAIVDLEESGVRVELGELPTSQYRRMR